MASFHELAFTIHELAFDVHNVAGLHLTWGGGRLNFARIPNDYGGTVGGERRALAPEAHAALASPPLGAPKD